MLLCFVTGALFLISGGLNAFNAHNRGKENQTTMFMGLAVFGVALLIFPIFVGNKTVAPAEAAVPGSPAPARTISGSINIPEPRYDASGQMIVQSATTDMDFDLCLKAITMTSSNVGAAPTKVVETNLVRIVKFPTNDGSILMTCSRPDQRLVVTLSPHR